MKLSGTCLDTYRTVVLGEREPQSGPGRGAAVWTGCTLSCPVLRGEGPFPDTAQQLTALERSKEWG